MKHSTAGHEYLCQANLHIIPLGIYCTCNIIESTGMKDTMSCHSLGTWTSFSSLYWCNYMAQFSRCKSLIDFRPSLQVLLCLQCRPGNIKFERQIRTASDANVWYMKQRNVSDLHRYLVLKIEVDKQWQEANSPSRLRAPVVPQNPLQTTARQNKKSQRIISRAY